MDEKIRTILTEAENKTIAGRAIELSDAIDVQMKTHFNEGKAKAFIDSERQRLRTAMAVDLSEYIEVGTKALMGLLDDAKKVSVEETAKNIHRRGTELQLCRNEFEAMGSDELEKKLIDVSAAEFMPDPLEVDAMFAVAQTRQIESGVIDACRQLCSEKNYRSPWLQKPKVRQARKIVDFYDSTDMFEIPLVVSGGKTSTLNFEDLQQ